MSQILIFPVIQSIFKLYSYNQGIPSTASSFPNNRISKFIIISFPSILTITNPISKLIIPPP